MSSRASGLLEREAEREALRSAFAAAARGEGGAVVISGPIGIGKTELLRAGLADARAAGLTTLLARASELEKGVALGVARQLFEPVLIRSLPAEHDRLLSGAAGLARAAFEPSAGGAAGAEDTSLALFHGLYWLCANLADSGPLVLAVDDLQWADAASQRWVAFLERRIDSLPVLLVVTLRTEGPESEDAATAELLPHLGPMLRPAPLSPAAVSRVVAEGFGSVPEPPFAQACHRATGGNPLFLHELLAGLRAQGVRPVARAAASVEEIGPRAIARLVRGRLRALGVPAERLARACAVLGDGADAVLVRELAGLEPTAFAEAVEQLTAAEIVQVQPVVAFAHPIVRAAVNVALDAEDRAELSRGAAALLRERGDLESVARHLLAVPPAGDAQVCATLREAAALAEARGAPEVAVDLLLRALLEPPEPATEAAVLHELALAELRTHAPVAPVHLDAALQRTPEGPLRARRAGDLAQALHSLHRPADALAVAEAALPTSSGAERDRLLTMLIEIAQFLPERAAISRRLAPALATVADPVLGARVRAIAAYDDAVAGRAPASEIAARSREALASGGLAGDTRQGSMPVFLACLALGAAGDADGASREIERVLRDAGRRGSVVTYSGALSVRARLRFATGDLRGCEADAQEIVALGDAGIGRDHSLAWLVESLVEQGRLDEAETAVRASALGGEVPELVALNPGLHARGRLRLAEGRLEEGLHDITAAGERQERVGARNPADLPWRGTAALALMALGRSGLAAEMSATNLELAQAFGSPGPHGAALRVCGQVVGGRRGHELLERAVQTLAASPAQLEHARALLAAGRARHAAGETEGARHALREARELAEELGARPVAEEAGTALLEAGGRPRRVRSRGRDALTPAERRTAEQVALGLSNREIAQALFVTEKTVEGHLRNVFRKLGISSRTQLVDVLGEPRSPVLDP